MVGCRAVGADQVSLNHVVRRKGEIDRVTSVARDHIAAGGRGAADPVVTGIGGSYAVGAISQINRAGGISPEEVSLDDISIRRA